MIIDFHTHTFPKKIVVSTIDFLSKKAHMSPSLSGTGEGLLESMDRAGVDKAVTFGVATKADQVPKLNDIAIKNVSSERLIPFGAMHPHYPDWENELIRIRDAGVKGVKIHPVYQQCPIDCPNFLSIFRRCAELGIVVLSHGGLDVGFPGVEYCGPDSVRNAIDKVPDLKLVMAHMGAWKQWDKAIKYLSDTPVYIDTSFAFGAINPIPGEEHYSEEELKLLGKEEFLKMVDAFSPSRILFGTDSPWTDQAKSIESIRDLGLSREDTEGILGNNAKNLLNI